MARSENGIVKRLLMSKLHELTRLSKRDGIAIDRVPDELDEVQQANDRELALAAIERDAVLANQVRFALKRLEKASTACASAARRDWLTTPRAVPWTSMCVTCQGMLRADQEGTSPGSSAMSDRLSPGGMTVPPLRWASISRVCESYLWTREGVTPVPLLIAFAATFSAGCELFDRALEAGGIGYRFGKIGVEPGRKKPLPVAAHRMGGERDHGYVAHRFRRSQTLHYVDSAHVWQGNVQYNDVGIGVRHFPQSGGARIKAGDV